LEIIPAITYQGRLGRIEGQRHCIGILSITLVETPTSSSSSASFRKLAVYWQV
jgi:hypothetical protein